MKNIGIRNVNKMLINMKNSCEHMFLDSIFGSNLDLSFNIGEFFLSQAMDNILDTMGILSGDPKSHEIALANVEYITV